jgi:hypothetical protein
MLLIHHFDLAEEIPYGGKFIRRSKSSNCGRSTSATEKFLELAALARASELDSSPASSLASEAAPILSVEVIEIRESTVFKMLGSR